jgi:putative inorganic carbon (hco3(-)) transporter
MTIFKDFKSFVRDCWSQDLAFYCAAAYLVFEYLRPHTIFPALDFLPWAQLSLMIGLAALIQTKSLKFQSSHFYLLLFVIVCLFSIFLSEYPEASYKAIEVPISWFVVVWVFTNSIRTEKQFKLILVLFFLIIFKMSLFGAKTWVLRGFAFTNWGIAGPRGWFENSGELALIMVIFTCLSYGYVSLHKNISRLYYLAPITGAMTILAASSRGSQLALAVVLVIAALTVWKINFKNIIFLGVLVWLGYTVLPEEQKARFETMGSDGTSESRLMYWEKGLEMLDDHPVIGIGLNAFPDYFEDYYLRYVNFENFSYRREVAHNTFIQVSSEMGYLGFFSYCLLIVFVYRASRRIRKSVPKEDWRYGYTRFVDLALVGYLIGSFFMSVAMYPYIYLFLSLQQPLMNICPNSKASKL